MIFRNYICWVQSTGLCWPDRSGVAQEVKRIRGGGQQKKRSKGASCREEKPNSSVSSLYFGVVETDIQQNCGFYILGNIHLVLFAPGTNFSLQCQLNISSFQVLSGQGTQEIVLIAQHTTLLQPLSRSIAGYHRNQLSV